MTIQVIELYIFSGSIFFFKQKTAYEMRISYWSSDVCSSDLDRLPAGRARQAALAMDAPAGARGPAPPAQAQAHLLPAVDHPGRAPHPQAHLVAARSLVRHRQAGVPLRHPADPEVGGQRGAGAEALKGESGNGEWGTKHLHVPDQRRPAGTPP